MHTNHRQVRLPPVRMVLLSVAALVLVWWVGVWIWGGSAKEAPSNPVWAGEVLPTNVFYVKEAWEREFFITALSPYQTVLYLKRAPKYFPYIEQELKNRNMPDDLKYLAVAESGLREDATSRTGAAGIWQFMPDTAKGMGLKVDGDIDERLHFEKSTQAALTYLKKLHDKFGSWQLAAAAYNRGENGLLRDLAAQPGVKTYAELDLNSETERYVYRIAAIAEVMRHPARYGVTEAEEDTYALPRTKDLITGGTRDLAAWAVAQGTTLRMVHELNPWILGDTLPEGSWVVRVVAK